MAHSENEKLQLLPVILLLSAAFLAIIFKNTSLNIFYGDFLMVPVQISFGEFVINKPLLLWVNDGLMAIFFFLIGLEIKREVCYGELQSVKNITLPLIAAIGGLVVPALIYYALNNDNPINLKGWAIPTATDIAFAVGILAAVGSSIPKALKVFLLSLAIIDDLAAIIIIALFYTDNLSLFALKLASVFIMVLFLLNRLNIRSVAPYVFVGFLLWAAVLKSGVHATLSGVILALFIPIRNNTPEPSPSMKLEKDLLPFVAYIILPLFAFTNSGIPLLEMKISQAFHSVPIGIALGLFFGKQIGVFLFSYLAIKFKFAKLPTGCGWLHIYGVGLLCGIGFTMSLFISSLAFDLDTKAVTFDERLGIFVGSILSGVAGFVVLKFFAKPKQVN